MINKIVMKYKICHTCQSEWGSNNENWVLEWYLIFDVSHTVLYEQVIFALHQNGAFLWVIWLFLVTCCNNWFEVEEWLAKDFEDM